MKVFSTIITVLIWALPICSQAQPQFVPQFKEVVYAPQSVNYHPMAPKVQKKRTPIEDMVWDNKVRCGSDMTVKTFAYEDDDGIWSGIDADLCRVIAESLLGDGQKIEMVNVKPKDMVKALDEGKIDVMLSGPSYSARTETSRQAMSAGFLYYDHQMLMVHADDADDLENYRGKKICLSTDSDYYKNFDAYNDRYNLGLKFLTFETLEQAKEAFLLNRCQMMTASGLMLHGILKDLPSVNAKILPQQVALHPVYAFVQRDNNELRLALKWIFNALVLAEYYDINALNLKFFATNDNPELRNLFGDTPELWTDLKVKSGWLRKAIPTVGNYGNIYDRNLGKDSDYKLEREEGRLVKDGGTIHPLPFM